MLEPRSNVECNANVSRDSAATWVARVTMEVYMMSRRHHDTRVLLTCICMMRCSTVSRSGARIFMMSLDTLTSRSCPSRWLLAMACMRNTTWVYVHHEALQRDSIPDSDVSDCLE